MYVCICNGHAEQDIREAAASGLTCPREIYASLGKPPQCGRCLNFAENLIDSVHEKLPLSEHTLTESS